MSLRQDLERLTGVSIYPASVVQVENSTFFLAQAATGKVLGVVGEAAGFEHTGKVATYPLTAANAAVLRAHLPWLQPRPLGLRKSIGCGDRLGLATPGHIRAVRHGCAAGHGLAPIFAQQSMRENARTGRTPQQVLDEAMWGVFQEGWREPWGADADHLKTTADIDLCVAAGYTSYTIDPGEHVDNAAHTADLVGLQAKFHALPWVHLQDSPDDLRARYLHRGFLAETFTVQFDELALLRAACKYGRAILHVARMYHHLAIQMGGTPSLPSSRPAFEVEVSVDETHTPTSPLEHLFIACELQRLGVHWVSLAPRFVGRFEKGTDYIGDLNQFEASFIQHAAIARARGPYKLSLHSGSDKLSIYPILSRHAGDLLHLKTAGTSYLEALRTVAAADPSFFRQILTFALQHYDEDKATYHVSADPARVPSPDDLANDRLAEVLDHFDAREVLHVTFGSVLVRFGQHLKDLLAEHEGAYYRALQAHFVKHLSLFA